MNALVRVCMLFPDLEGFKRKSNDQLTRSTSSQMSRARKVNKKDETEICKGKRKTIRAPVSSRKWFSMTAVNPSTLWNAISVRFYKS